MAARALLALFVALRAGPALAADQGSCAAGGPGAVGSDSRPSLAADLDAEAAHVHLLQREVAHALHPNLREARPPKRVQSRPRWGSGFNQLNLLEDVKAVVRMPASAERQWGSGFTDLSGPLDRPTVEALFARADHDGDGMLDKEEAMEMAAMMEKSMEDYMSFNHNPLNGSSKEAEETWGKCSSAFQEAYDCTFLAPWEGGARCGCSAFDCHHWFGWCMGTLPFDPLPSDSLPLKNKLSIPTIIGQVPLWASEGNFTDAAQAGILAGGTHASAGTSTATSSMKTIKVHITEADSNGDLLLSPDEAMELANTLMASIVKPSPFPGNSSESSAGNASSSNSTEATWSRCQSAFQRALDCTFIPAWEGGARCGCGENDCHKWFGWCMGTLPEDPTPSPKVPLEDRLGSNSVYGHIPLEA